MARLGVLVSVLVAAVLVAGCGTDEATPDDGVTGSRTLTVYVSLPLQGEAAPEARDAVDAIKLALSDAGGRVGPFTVNLAVLDDATKEAGGWDREATLETATRAARDRNAIAVIGDWDADASALSIPIYNAAELPQVSPAAGYIGLTRDGGVAKGEPEKYYPSARPTFARVVPADDLLAEAMLAQVRRAGARSVFLVNDRSLYGKGLMAQVQRRAERDGLLIAGREDVEPAADQYEDLGQRIRDAKPGAVLVGASVRNGAIALVRDIGAANPRLPMIMGEALLLRSFTRGVPASVASQVSIVSPALAPGAGPPSLGRFAASFAKEFGREPSPMAAYAYTAMQAVLAAVRSAGTDGNDRDAVRAALFGLQVKATPIGPLTLDRRGDTAQTRFGLWELRDGQATFARSIETRR